MSDHPANPKIDPRSHWEKTITAWDANRHGGRKDALSWIERHSRLSPDTIKYRYDVARAHLSQHAQNKRVVEVGCGPGRLSEKIIEAGARSYRGYDIAENAVMLAREAIAHSPFKDRIEFERADISSLPAISGDIVFSVGFLSWLTSEQIGHLFAISRGVDFLHTITVPTFGYRQFLKWLHHQAGHSQSYRVLYKSIGDIDAIAKRHGWPRLYVYRHRRLSPNVYVSSLPFPGTLGPQIIL